MEEKPGGEIHYSSPEVLLLGVPIYGVMNAVIIRSLMSNLEPYIAIKTEMPQKGWHPFINRPEKPSVVP